MGAKFTDEATARLWKDYRANGGEPLRNQLLQRYLHVVRYNAERVAAKLPQEVEADDLLAAGVFGADGAGQRMRVLIRDSAGRPERAERAVRELADQGVTAIIGPLLTNRFNDGSVGRMRYLTLIGFVWITLGWLFMAHSSHSVMQLVVTVTGATRSHPGGRPNDGTRHRSDRLEL